jgi:hypothetical protein
MTRILVLLVVLWLAGAAWGQSFYDDLKPGLGRKDYQAIVSRLDLTKEQRGAADQLFEGYTEEHTREAVAFEAAWKALGKGTHFNRETGESTHEPGVQEAWEEALKKYNTFKPKAKGQVIADIKALLTEAQTAEKWPGVDRFVRRMLMKEVLFTNPVDWVRADISGCVGDLKLAPEALAKVQPQLDEYELSVDKPLRRMEQVWGQSGEDVQRTFREAVREVGALNRRYLRVIAQELPPEDAASLTGAAKALAYWMLYHNDGKFIREGFAKAKKLPSFTEEQQKKADALFVEIDKFVAQYRKDATPDYDEAAEKAEHMTQKEWEEASNREDNPFMKLSLKWSQPFSDTWVSWVDRMQAILTEEQRHELWPPSGDSLHGLR